MDDPETEKRLGRIERKINRIGGLLIAAAAIAVVALGQAGFKDHWGFESPWNTIVAFVIGSAMAIWMAREFDRD